MRHVDLKKPITVEVLQEQIAGMVNKELLTFEQAEEIAIEKVISFFDSDLGKRVLAAKSVEREVPFTMMLKEKKHIKIGKGRVKKRFLSKGLSTA